MVKKSLKATALDKCSYIHAEGCVQEGYCSTKKLEATFTSIRRRDVNYMPGVKWSRAQQGMKWFCVSTQTRFNVKPEKKKK
jgi:hypothetical protein